MSSDRIAGSSEATKASISSAAERHSSVAAVGRRASHWGRAASLMLSIRLSSTADGTVVPDSAAAAQRLRANRSQKAMCAKSAAAVQGGSISSSS